MAKHTDTEFVRDPKDRPDSKAPGTMASNLAEFMSGQMATNSKVNGMVANGMDLASSIEESGLTSVNGKMASRPDMEFNDLGVEHATREAGLLVCKRAMESRSISMEVR